MYLYVIIKSVFPYAITKTYKQETVFPLWQSVYLVWPQYYSTKRFPNSQQLSVNPILNLNTIPTPSLQEAGLGLEAMLLERNCK